MEKENKSFNWTAFFCSACYYAGKGKFQKGAILALLNFMPITWILTGIYCGKKANTELTQGNFNWGPAIAVGLIQTAICTFVLSLKGA